MNKGKFINSALHHGDCYVENDEHHFVLHDGHKDGYDKYTNECTNVIIFEQPISKTTIDMVAEHFKAVYALAEICLSSNRVKFTTPSTPLDRAHLKTLCLFTGSIRFYHYDPRLDHYGHEL